MAEGFLQVGLEDGSQECSRAYMPLNHKNRECSPISNHVLGRFLMTEELKHTGYGFHLDYEMATDD